MRLPLSSASVGAGSLGFMILVDGRYQTRPCRFYGEGFVSKYLSRANLMVLVRSQCLCWRAMLEFFARARSSPPLRDILEWNWERTVCLVYGTRFRVPQL